MSSCGRGGLDGGVIGKMRRKCTCRQVVKWTKSPYIDPTRTIVDYQTNKSNSLFERIINWNVEIQKKSKENAENKYW